MHGSGVAPCMDLIFYFFRAPKIAILSGLHGIKIRVRVLYSHFLMHWDGTLRVVAILLGLSILEARD